MVQQLHQAFLPQDLHLHQVSPEPLAVPGQTAEQADRVSYLTAVYLPLAAEVQQEQVVCFLTVQEGL